VLKCYHHLHSWTKNFIVDQGFDENCSLGIFEILASSNELVKELVNKEFLIFMRFQVDAKNVKCFFQCWEKHESMFSIVVFIAHKILSIVGSQIEFEKIFSLVGILLNIRRCL
jgi:hypothetical protein